MNFIKDIKSNKMLWSAFLSSLLYAISFPFINKIMITNISYKYISMNGIIMALAVIIIGFLWKKYDDYLYFNFISIMILEIFLYFIVMSLFVFGVIKHSPYYVADTIIFAFITRLIQFSSNKLLSEYIDNPEKRRNYDDNAIILQSAGCLIGYSIGMFINLPIVFIFFIAFLGISIDNIIYINIYKSINKQKEEN